MKKIDAWKIRIAYGIFLAALTVLLGLLYIFQCADIYYSGLDSDVIFSYEIVSQRLSILLVPSVLWVVAVIIGYVFTILIPSVKKQKVYKANKVNSRKSNLPIGESEQVSARQAKLTKVGITRVVLWSVCVAFAFVASIVSIVYLSVLSLSNGVVNGEILAMLRNILPLLFMTFVLCVGALIYECVIAPKERRIGIYVIRLVVFCMAVVFLIVGIVNGGKDDVLMKAINICTECIGLG